MNTCSGAAAAPDAQPAVREEVDSSAGMHAMISRRLIGGLILLSLTAGATATRAGHAWFAESPPLAVVGTGVAEIFDTHQEIYWNMEYRPAFRFYHIGPWLSFGTGKSHEFYAGLGLLIDFELGRDWVCTPSFGGGYYNAASGLDLGFDAEFRSGLELSKRFANGQRLGLAFSHISNGSLGRHNPGSETLGLNYVIPIGRIFRHRTAPRAAD